MSQTNQHEHGDMHEDHGMHDHTEHHRMMIRDFRKRFYVTLVLTIPVLALAPMIQGFLGFSSSFPGSNYIVFGLASVFYFYGGWPFLSGLKSELSDPEPGHDDPDRPRDHGSLCVQRRGHLRL